MSSNANGALDRGVAPCPHEEQLQSCFSLTGATTTSHHESEDQEESRTTGATTGVSQYLQELLRLKHRVVVERLQGAVWKVILSIRETKELNLNLSDKKATDACQNILANLNAPNGNDNNNMALTLYHDHYDEDDDFIVFQEEEVNSDGTTMRQWDESSGDPMTTRLSVPVVFALSVERVSEQQVLTPYSRHKTQSFESVRGELLVEVLDVIHYPDQPPTVSLELKKVSRRAFQTIQRVIESLMVDWSLKRLAHPNLELVLDTLIDLLDGQRMTRVHRDVVQGQRQLPLRSKGSRGSQLLASPTSFSSSRSSSPSSKLSENEDLQDPLWPVLERPDEILSPCPSRSVRASATDSMACHTRSRVKRERGNFDPSVGLTSALWDDEERNRADSSRYLRDFEEVSVLGVGAFGRVTKCRARILSHHNNKRLTKDPSSNASPEAVSADATCIEYAIKRIPLVADSLALQREAANLAVLHHPNIVRYYSAWIESSSMDTKLAPTSSLSLSWKRSLDKRRKSDSFHPYDSEGPSDRTNESEQRPVRRQRFFSSTRALESNEGRNRSSMSRGRNHPVEGSQVERSNRRHGCRHWTGTSDEFSLTPSAVTCGFQSEEALERCLFIQMELCKGQTLRKAIESGCLYDHKWDKPRPELIWNLFRQLLSGMAYMHVHGLLHRDLKPDNIFLDGDPLESYAAIAQTSPAKPATGLAVCDRAPSAQPKVHVKIGDFGLTTFIGSSSPNAQITGDFVWRRNSQESSKGAGLCSHLSEGVGTKFYMAPEQEAGGVYNSSADMFSLGVVFFELWHPPFKTAMERAVVLTNLIKHGGECLPDYFLRKVPKEVPIVLRLLLSASPSDRIPAQALLHSSLLPHVDPEEFQSVYDVLSKDTFSSQTSQIIATLFNRQLEHQLYKSTHLGHRLLPDLEKFSWRKHLVLTDVVSCLDRVFRNRGALRVESLILFPLSSATLPSSVHTDTKDQHSGFLLGSAFALNPNHRVLLDRHGAPVFFPTRLVLGFAKTAPAFLTSGPSISRRFAIQNVQYSSSFDFVSQPLIGGFPFAVSEHMHAFYDVGIQLSRALEPDVRNAIFKNISSAMIGASKSSTRSDPAKLLLYLMRLPMSTLSLRRAAASAFRRVYAFHAIALIEAEVVAVTCQAIGSVNCHSHKRDIAVYWTHAMFLPALLYEVFGVPLPDLRNLQRRLSRALSGNLSKEELQQQLSGIRLNPRLDAISIKRTAEVLHHILCFKGEVRAWIKEVQQYLHPSTVEVSVISVVDLVLRHIEFLDLLLSGFSTSVPIYFTPTFIYDDNVFGKGLTFIATPNSSRGMSTRGIDQRVAAVKDHPDFKGGVGRVSEQQRGAAAILKEKSLDQRPSGIRGRMPNRLPWTANQAGTLGPEGGSNPSDILEQISPRGSLTMKSGAAAVLTGTDADQTCSLCVPSSAYQLAVGGCYDFLVSQMNPYVSWSASDAVVGVEIAVDHLIDFCYGAAATTTAAILPSNIHYAGPRLVPDSKGAAMTTVLAGNVGPWMGSNLKPLLERQLPHVFITVLRSEQQVYATSLRLQLLRQGIQCQRRIDRSVDASQFRRRVRSASNIVWLVQIRDHPMHGVSYKLQYFGDHPSGIETEQVFLREVDAVNFLTDNKSL